MTYPQLRQKVETTLSLAQDRMRRIKLEAYWEAGHYIHQHILENQDRAEYGKEVLSKLTADLRIDRTVLYRLVQFARDWPKKAIVAAPRQLSWGHYQELLSIKDPKERATWLRQTVRLGWNTHELRVKVREGRLKALGPASLEKPVLGPIHTCRIVGNEKIDPSRGKLFIDLGFTIYLDAAPFQALGLKEGDLVTFGKDGVVQKLANLEELFTYRAYLEKVVDADTLRVQIDLGFGLTTRQYVRLQGLDAPEKGTPAGEKAQAFVEKELRGESYLTIKTSKPEKFDRYLSDVFYKNGIYLNQRLLDTGQATPM
ncbi:MAG: thermonuclease family protein [Deltaproteobacteria bacterium]|nr:thermonuclease family protein [Deltaproteobacteria bacterium]